MAELTEKLAESIEEVSARKEEAQKAESLLKDTQSKLSSKSQGLEVANGTIKDLKARTGSLEGSREAIEAREQHLSKDLDTTIALTCIKKFRENKRKNAWMFMNKG